MSLNYVLIQSLFIFASINRYQTNFQRMAIKFKISTANR